MNKAYVKIRMLLSVLFCIHLLSAQTMDTQTKTSGDNTYNPIPDSTGVMQIKQPADSLLPPVQTRACVNTYTNQTISSNIFVTGCSTLTLQNITVSNGGNLSFSASGEITINGPFDVLSGGSLNDQAAPDPEQPEPGTVGDNMQTPIEVGTFDDDFTYTDTKHTSNFTNQHPVKTGRDIFYKFEITTMMDITISHCDSELAYTYIHLLNESGAIVDDAGFYTNTVCSFPERAHLTVTSVPAGIYYVVSEAKAESYRDMNITTRISGVTSFLPGDTRETAIDVGTHNAYFEFKNVQETYKFSDRFQGLPTSDVFYKFTITRPMEIEITLCGSHLDNTHIYLLNSSGAVITSYSFDWVICEFNDTRTLVVPDLSPGTYYVVSEGSNENGNIYTQIWGRDINIPGDTRETAINVGTYGNSFSYSDTKHTWHYSDQHPGQTTNDIFYGFTITVPMNVTVSHCESEVTNTHFYLLDAAGNTIVYNNEYSTCPVSSRSHETMYLSPGMYYVVSEGWSGGNITTQISGETIPLFGNTREEPIDAGTYTTAFSYTNTQNTESFTDEYTGLSTNDVFYKFTTTVTMDVTVTHCGSGLGNTFLHLLDASGNRIALNDNDFSGCSNGQQAYLTIPDLSAGTYYVVSEGYSLNGSITTNITGTVSAPSQPGDNRTMPIDAGTYGTFFTYTDTRNTEDYTDQYTGLTTRDVFYKFVTTVPMDVTVSHCGSAVSDTYLHLLNASGTRMYYNNDNLSGCGNPFQAYLTVPNLPAGTYYVVSEGYSQNGNIATTIVGNIKVAEPADPVIPSPSVTLSADQNYVLTKTARAAVSASSSLTTANSMQVVQYYDGLGRPVETVHIAAGPQRQDLVSYREYDSYGRESKTWLPANPDGANGSFRQPETVRSAVPGRYGGDTRPFSETQYEQSPLNRPEKVYGPGQDWYGSHPVQTAYLTNASSGELACTYYYLSGNNIVKSGAYPSNQLYVVKTTDEDGNSSYAFTDKAGRIILQRQVNEGSSPNHDTYYVYDDRGNLRYVLPPLAADASKMTDAIGKYAYVYIYDHRNRCIEKKLPGAEPIYYVYDRADRLILSQDGVQRSANEWTFRKYDPLGRIILSGLLTDRSTRESLTAICKDLLVTETRGTAIMGYTNTSLPIVTTSHILQANYYDNYSWLSVAALQQSSTPSEYAQPHGSAQGRLTGTLVRTLNGTNKTLTTSLYYDYKGNLVGKHAETILSGYEHEYYGYNFAGEVERKMLKHCGAANSELLSEVYTYEYDPAGRMKKKLYALNGGTPIQMASFRYDHLGRLLTKYTGGLELTTYTYTVRSWMTALAGQRFSETLSYSGQYGGNIASLTWDANGTGNRSYAFTYDKLGRMKQATYSAMGGGNYNEAFVYDKHGNPQLISRYGRMQNGASYTYGPMDNLTMSAASYDGNRLTAVSESVANQPDYDLMEFRKRSVSAPHYTYDANGRLTKDAHKNIGNIQYNYLHLPKQVTFGDGKSITYVHDASGVKHEVRYTNPSLNPATSMTNYVSNQIYENGALSMVLTEEGYLRKVGNTYQSFYYVKDHLGSNRIVIDGASGGVVQTTNYYPYGMSFAERPPKEDQSVQRYKYTGKELDREHGLNLYDYGARMYDPALGIFTTPDPLAEKYYAISPYVYVGNNPVKFIDPDGRSYDYPPTGGSLTDYQRMAANKYIEDKIKENSSLIQYNATVGLAAMSDVNDAAVLTTTVTRGGDAINIDGTPATIVDKGFAALGSILPVVSGSTLKSGLKSIGKALGIGERAAKVTRALSKGENIIGSKFDKVLPTQDWINPSQVEHYKGLIQAGENVPAVRVYRQNGKVYIEDGHHRYAAYKELGVEPKMIISEKGGPVGFPDWTNTTYQTSSY